MVHRNRWFTVRFKMVDLSMAMLNNQRVLIPIISSRSSQLYFYIPGVPLYVPKSYSHDIPKESSFRVTQPPVVFPTVFSDGMTSRKSRIWSCRAWRKNWKRWMLRIRWPRSDPFFQNHWEVSAWVDGIFHVNMSPANTQISHRDI